MTFTYEGADLSKTIKNYYRNGDSYYIEFLDGTSKQYETGSIYHEQLLESVMFKQALERRDAILEEYAKKRNGEINNFSISIPTIMTKTQNEVLRLSNFCMAGITEGIRGYIESVRIVRELKKYEMYLEIVRTLPLSAQIELLNSVEFDHIYQVPLTINSVDRFNYGKIRGLYKKFVKNKTTKKN